MSIRSRYDIFIDNVIDWASAANPDDMDKWKYFFVSYLNFWGWNKKAIKDFWDFGTFTNGFNMTELQFDCSVQDFYSEVPYCSDRM